MAKDPLKEFLDAEKVSAIINEIAPPESSDSMMMGQVSLMLSALWTAQGHTPNVFELLPIMLSSYVLGYRKGRAATPLTLIVADDDGKEV